MKILELSLSGNKNVLSHEIAASILADIQKGRYALGSKIPKESELQAIYGVGRGTIREAVRILRQKGCLDIRRGMHGGMYVCKPNPESMRRNILSMLMRSHVAVEKVIEFRQAFDAALFWVVIKNMDTTDIALLHNKTRQIKELIHKGGIEYPASALALP